MKALPGFWSAVLQRSEVGEAIEEHDEPVLAALQDIRHESAASGGEECAHGAGLRATAREKVGDIRGMIVPESILSNYSVSSSALQALQLTEI